MKGIKSLLSVLAACIVLVGLAVPGFPEAAGTDLVVVGAGATGIAAAITAVEGGAKVIIFEKMPYAGGTSNFAEGLFGAESAMQRAEYVGLTRDQAFKTIMDYSHWRANPRLVRAYVDESASTVAWLQKMGVEFVGPKAVFPDGPLVFHLLKGPPEARGAGVMKMMIAKAKEKGVDLRLSTPVVKLIKEGNRITGVVAENNGKTIEVKAKAVIVATGGYANNAEWIKKYAGFDLGKDIYAIGSAGKMGDGIRMAWEAGAAEEGMGVLQLLRGGPVLGEGLKFIGSLESAGHQPNLRVDQNGIRYADESIMPNFAYDGNATARLKGRYAFTIFDEAQKRYWAENGVDFGTGFIVPPGTRINIDSQLKEVLDKKNPNVFVADTIEELAAKMGVSPAVLKATVDEYNSFCAKGHDDLFAKDPKYLRPIKEPKFYAFKTFTVFLCSHGGVKINEKMEVIDKSGKVIPGLYVGGADAGGMYGDSYNVLLAGGTAAFSWNSGRIAARNALKYMGK